LEVTSRLVTVSLVKVDNTDCIVIVVTLQCTKLVKYSLTTKYDRIVTTIRLVKLLISYNYILYNM